MTSSNENIFHITGPLCGVTREFPTQRPMTWSFDVFFDLWLNKQLSKQLWSWWFEMPLRSLWHHCNVFKKQWICWWFQVLWHSCDITIMANNPSIQWVKITIGSSNRQKCHITVHHNSCHIGFHSESGPNLGASLSITEEFCQPRLTLYQRYMTINTEAICDWSRYSIGILQVSLTY